MVGRLIQQQEVGVFAGQQSQSQPASFTAAQQAYRLVNVITAKQVAGQVISRFT